MSNEFLDKLFEHKHELLFVAGAATALAGYKALKSDTVKKHAVNTMAKAMCVQKSAEENFQNMKDDAEDICLEAKSKNQEKVFVDAEKVDE